MDFVGLLVLLRFLRILKVYLGEEVYEDFMHTLHEGASLHQRNLRRYLEEDGYEDLVEKMQIIKGKRMEYSAELKVKKLLLYGLRDTEGLTYFSALDKQEVEKIVEDYDSKWQTRKVESLARVMGVSVEEFIAQSKRAVEQMEEQKHEGS